MMYKKYKTLEIIGFFVVSALAVGFHFLYDATQSPILAAVSPVNESIWEHIKIIFFPYLIWAIVEMLILKPADKCAFLKAKSYGLAALPIMLIVFYYTYSGILGYNSTAVDIAATFVYIAIAFFMSYRAYKYSWSRLSKISAALAIIFALMLIVFTYTTPKLPLFKDPVTGKYGI